jgi:hypothetical protein
MLDWQNPQEIRSYYIVFAYRYRQGSLKRQAATIQYCQFQNL